MSFWPRELELRDWGVTSIAALIAWVLGSILMLIVSLLLSSFWDIWDALTRARTWIWELNSFFPILLSMITFIVTSGTVYLTYYFMHITNPERYKRNVIISGQIAFFTFLTYLFLVPVYVYMWMKNYDYIMIVFLLHVIIVIFWTSLIIEILNNYRYVLVSVYGSFIWLFISIIIASLIFSIFETGQSKMIALFFLLPLINFLQVFVKGWFDILYYNYSTITGHDQIGDIFYQIESEEKEQLKEEEEKNSI